jgi:putative nucleotidyltransferase with HDIG domain
MTSIDDEAFLAAEPRAPWLPGGAEVSVPLSKKPIATMAPRSPDVCQVSARPTLAETLSTLSQALDLAEGRSLGHARRVCLLALRLAQRLRLPAAELSDVAFGALLHDAGVTTISHTLSRLATAGETEVLAVHASADAEIFARMIEAGAVERLYDQMGSHAAVGAEIAHSLRLSGGACEAIRYHHERWDGLGVPDGLFGEDIPRPAQVIAAADVIETCLESASPLTGGAQAAAQAAIEVRSGGHLDPRVARAAADLFRDPANWQELLADDVAWHLGTLPENRILLDVPHLNTIAHIFATIVDNKSPYTLGHSVNVAHYAVQLARQFGFREDTTERLRMAALLHDLGKLAVPNRILDKTETLSDEEYRLVREHPELTDRILSEVSWFDEIRTWAAAHHERMSGVGYPNRLRSDQLPMGSRILAVADVYEALTAHRPYRKPMPRAEAVITLWSERDLFDSRVVAALARMMAVELPEP